MITRNFLILLNIFLILFAISSINEMHKQDLEISDLRQELTSTRHKYEALVKEVD